VEHSRARAGLITDLVDQSALDNNHMIFNTKVTKEISYKALFSFVYSVSFVFNSFQ
jgi:hypothetical protein